VVGRVLLDNKVLLVQQVLLANKETLEQRDNKVIQVLKVTLEQQV
jgi:hypothetical protein